MQGKLAWTFGITTVALFMTALDNLVVVTALPRIQKDLHASLSSLEWTVNAYTLTFAVLLLTGAALGDRFGRKRLFVIGMSIFTAASALAALARSRCADRGPGATGSRRRDHDPVDAHDPRRTGAAGEAGSDPRRLGRNRRARRRHRPARRRGDHHGDRVAVDLLAERPDRPDHRSARRSAAERIARPVPHTRSRRTRRSPLPASRHRLGRRPRRSVGWGSGEVLGTTFAGLVLLGCVYLVGAPLADADVAAALLPQTATFAQ